MVSAMLAESALAAPQFGLIATKPESVYPRSLTTQRH